METTLYDTDDLDLARDLAAFLGDDAPPDDWTPDDDVEPPETRDPDAADRILRRLALIDVEASRIQSFAEREVELIQAWARRLLAGLDRTRDWNARSLEGWARANWSKPTTGHTWKFPHGEVSLRKAQPRLTVDALDDAGLDAVAAAIPAAVKTERKVVASEIKKIATAGEPGPVVGPPDADGYQAHAVMTAAGERVPGATLLVPTRLSFGAKPAEGDRS